MFIMIQSLPETYQFVLLVLCVVLVLALGITTIGFWSHVRRIQIEADLKTEMLERGLSVDEIQALLAAQMRGKRRYEVDAELKAHLADQGLDAKQIKQIVSCGVNNPWA